jgi:hypothetical protein
MKLAQDEGYVLLVIGLIGLILFAVILYKIIIWGIRGDVRRFKEMQRQAKLLEEQEDF